MTVVGCNALLGGPGIGVGAVLTMFIGNPLSSAQAPLEFMPWRWGSIGQFFVPGAATTLLRTHAYFPKASLTQPLLVLLGWIALGLILMFAGHYRSAELIHLEGYTAPDRERHPHAAPTADARAAVAGDVGHDEAQPKQLAGEGLGEVAETNATHRVDEAPGRRVG